MSGDKASFHSNIQQLIAKITKSQEDSQACKSAFDKIKPYLANSNTTYYPDKNEVDFIIHRLGEKFAFHGYIRQKLHLQNLYQKLVPDEEVTRETVHRLSVVKFLIEISQSPTKNFSDHCEIEPEAPEESINWKEYLNDLGRWSPPPDESSEESDELWEDTSDSLIDNIDANEAVKPKHDDVQSKVPTLSEIRERLRSNIQSGWYKSRSFYMKPQSEMPAANVTSLWQQHLEKISRGLISLDNPNVIHEYLVLREVIWQMFVPHSGACFHRRGNKLVVAPSIAISSVRMPAFQNFLDQFLPYMDYFEALHTFSRSLSFLQDHTVPDTYRNYDMAVKSVTKPMLDKLMKIEEAVVQQETIYSLLTLANDLRSILKPLRLLNSILENVIVDFKTNSTVVCATTLLSRLYKLLVETSSKLEQDLYLTLYLQSLSKYLTIVHSWLGSGDLVDQDGEFVIANSGTSDYLTKELNSGAEDDPFLQVICTKVLQIGRNIHILRRLGKYRLFFECLGDRKESLYDAFIARVLNSTAAFFPQENESVVEEEDEVEGASAFTFPFEDCKYYTEMDRLEKLVDTSDVFLMKAFEPYFIKKPEAKVAEQESLYGRIQKLTKSLFPVHIVVINAFVDVLNERYEKIGFVVKNLLVHDYHVSKYFELFQHIFLFYDDLIFPFYKRLFKGVRNRFPSSVGLTSLLQDVVMDLYPSFYNKISVEVNEAVQVVDYQWEVCELVNLKFRVDWPVDLIITTNQVQMYKRLFKFILKIKWALYTLNQLDLHGKFEEVIFTPKFLVGLAPKKGVQITKSLQPKLSKLRILRFGLLNEFNAIQHYILGYAFSVISSRFFSQLENAHDFESLTKAHANFIHAFHAVCCNFENCPEDGDHFVMLLRIVEYISAKWKNPNDFDCDDLFLWEKSYWRCQQKFEATMNEELC